MKLDKRTSTRGMENQTWTIPNVLKFDHIAFTIAHTINNHTSKFWVHIDGDWEATYHNKEKEREQMDG